MKLPEIIVTDDGSHSLFSNDLNESYHSTFGAINESKHIFIDGGLKRLSLKGSIKILEIGFGTGLNVWLTLLESMERKIQIEFHSIEPFPIPLEIYNLLNYAAFSDKELARERFTSIHQADWNRDIELTELFHLNKQNTKLEESILESDFYHLVYFDAFSPEVQPELWTTGIFRKIYKAMKQDGIFVTYSAKGSVRRNLVEAGFDVERIPGPKGKRETIRAIKH